MALTRKITPSSGVAAAAAEVAAAAPAPKKEKAVKAAAAAVAEEAAVEVATESTKGKPLVQLFRTPKTTKASKDYEVGDRLPQKEFIKSLTEKLQADFEGFQNITQAGVEKLFGVIQGHLFDTLTDHPMKLMGKMVRRKVSPERWFINPVLSDKITFSPEAIELSWKYFFGVNVTCYERADGTFEAGEVKINETTKEEEFVISEELTRTLAPKWAAYKASKVAEVGDVEV